MSRTNRVDKAKIARSFLRGKPTYDSHAKSQKRVSAKLIERLGSYPEINYERVLEIGCCTGTLTELLLKGFNVKKLYLNDLVPTFFDHVVERVSPLQDVEIVPVVGDVEHLDFPVNLDLVISSATLQWLHDLSSLFQQISLSLKNNGYFAFSIFGPGTLREFKEITGIGLKYLAVEKILELLEKDFHIEEEETYKDKLFFPSPKDILKHLQATGVSGVQEYKWTPGKLRDFEKKYIEQFGGESGVPVTYMSSYIIASKKV